MVIGIDIAIMLTTRALVGPVGMQRAVLAGAIAVMEQWLMWTVMAGGAIAGVVVARRHARAPLATALLVAFVTVTWVAAFGPVAIYLGACGPGALSCVHQRTDTAQIVAGTLAGVAPVEVALATALLYGVVAAVRGRPRGLAAAAAGTRWASPSSARRYCSQRPASPLLRRGPAA